MFPARGFNEAVERVVNIGANRLDLLVGMKQRVQARIGDAGDVSRRVVGEAEILEDGGRTKRNR